MSASKKTMSAPDSAESLPNLDKSERSQFEEIEAKEPAIHSPQLKKCTTYTIGGEGPAPHILPRGNNIDGWRDDGNQGIDIEYNLDPTDSLPPKFFELLFARPEVLTLPKFCLSKIKRANPKPLLTEKLLWFCDQLHATGASTDQGAPVNVHFCKRRLGMRGSDLIQKLVNLELIEKCSNHRAGFRAAKYRFVKAVRRDERDAYVKLKNKRLIRNRGSKQHLTKARLAATGLPIKFFEDLSRISAPPEFFEMFDARIEKMQSEGKSIASMKALRDFWHAGRVRMTIDKFRITTHICGTPSKLRELLLVDGEAAHEIDLPNSHPALLASLFRPTDQSTDTEIEQHAKLVALVQSAKFYEAFEHCWKSDRHVFAAYVAPVRDKTPDQLRHERRRFLKIPARKGIKLCWQVILNCQPTFYDTQIMRELGQSLPYFTRRFLALKRSGKDALGSALRKNEARMVAAIAKGVTEPCGTIFDSWLTSALGVGQVIEAARIETAREAHLGFMHLPLRKGEPKPEHPDAEAWRQIGRDAAANGKEAPF